MSVTTDSKLVARRWRVPSGPETINMLQWRRHWTSEGFDIGRRRLTVREIGELGISKDSAHAILTQDLGIRRVAAKFIPKILSQKQQVHLEIAQDLPQITDSDPD